MDSLEAEKFRSWKTGEAAPHLLAQVWALQDPCISPAQGSAPQPVAECRAHPEVGTGQGLVSACPPGLAAPWVPLGQVADLNPLSGYAGGTLGRSGVCTGHAKGNWTPSLTQRPARQMALLMHMWAKVTLIPHRREPVLAGDAFPQLSRGGFCPVTGGGPADSRRRLHQVVHP